MAMRYLAGKLRAPAAAALRRPRSLSADASQGGRSNATTENVATNTDGELGWVQEEIAKLEKFRLEIEETARYDRFHERRLIGSVFAGLGLGCLACAWHSHCYRKAVKEQLDNRIVWMPPYSTSSHK